MEEYSKECEFWLPPQFLTDDDILLGFKTNSKGEENEMKSYFGCGFKNEFSFMLGPKSDLSSPVESVVGSTETESSDEEDYITELTRQMAHSTLENHKVQSLSSSPQSTLYGVLGYSKHQGSNIVSPNCSSQSRNGVVDLLYEAVGEVARMKMMEKEAGICRHKSGIWAPPRKASPAPVDPRNSKPNLASFYSNQPPQSYQQLQMAQFQRLKQQQIMKQGQGVLCPEKERFWNQQQLNQRRGQNGADRSVSAWPTLQQSHQQQQQTQPGSGMRAVFLGNTGPKRECAGTGVFIPKRPGIQTEPRKKTGCSTVLMPERVVQALNLNLDVTDSRLQSMVQPSCNNGGVLKYQNNLVDQQRRSLRTHPAVKSQEIILPQEWTY
ncbi:uncharacterized protein LOC107809166 [Nicotiana tabacum]|uniref:Uncharacterized protein LOC107809166 n=2 Tax=Nicotiana TaxID=4085 RepID=A0A1S4BK50_TOBAC|nr:PREDICTED: uncharacterized protein LOC104226044 [Nicotiana sylvestris]XP_016489245.1 PREDICTED: uncharacterized protein LOC107809166 [Nicotiana tabacum]